MPIEFACESCKKLLRVPDGSGGLSCECPSCHRLLEIPNPDAIKVVVSAKTGANTNKLAIPCPKCKHDLLCSPELLGSKGQCKHCKYIFTISTESEIRGRATEAESSGLIFTCPKCDQLFEGQESMRGRKGKCHACGEVFRIELRTAESSTDAPVQQTIQRTAARPRQQPSPQPRPQRAPASGNSAIQLTCSSCQGVMEVPASAAGQTTACPFCQLLLHIPDH